MNCERAIEILDRLVAFPTVSSESNLDLVDYVVDLLEKAGAQIRVITNDEGNKANVLAVIGTGNEPGLMLSGHTDVVPVAGQAWTSDPFRLRRSDGRLYGRGTCDMKGFVACALATAEKAAQRTLRRPLTLALSHDEEIGCVGVRSLIDHLKAHPAAQELCVVGEPTQMTTVVGHKGKLAGKIVCIGRECHSSAAPHGLNAIHLGCEMIAFLRQIQARWAASDRSDVPSDIPYPTVHVGTISGGSALNIVPNECTVAFEVRSFKEEEAASIVEEIAGKAQDLAAGYRQQFPECDIKVQVENSYPGLLTPASCDAVSIVNGLTGNNGAGYVAFGTEGGLFSGQLGIPTVVCGPGNVTQAHKPDEFVEVAQIERCMDLLDGLVQRLA